MNREALVIHPKLSVYAGAEYLCLHLCKTLQGLGFEVSLVSDAFEPWRAEDLYGMGEALSKTHHIRLPRSRQRIPRPLLPIERLVYTVRLARFANKLKDCNSDVVFSTQSSIFYFPGKRLYHFVYEVTDLFNYPMPLVRTPSIRGEIARRIYFRFLRLVYGALAGQPTPNWFFVTGQKVLQSLRQSGYSNSSFFFPPSRVFQLKLPKQRRILQACRIAPEKRIEFMFDVAKRLPDYSFILAGKNLEANMQSHPGYGRHLLKRLPPNLEYTETLIRDNPDLLQLAKVYFHTGLERGMLLVLLEAVSAGCILVVPEEGVASEVVKATGVGYTYRTIDEAVEKLKIAMDGNTPWTPSEISERSRRLGPDGFERMITQLIVGQGQY